MRFRTFKHVFARSPRANLAKTLEKTRKVAVFAKNAGRPPRICVLGLSFILLYIYIFIYIIIYIILYIIIIERKMLTPTSGCGRLPIMEGLHRLGRARNPLWHNDLQPLRVGSGHAVACKAARILSDSNGFIQILTDSFRFYQPCINLIITTR